MSNTNIDIIEQLRSENYTYASIGKTLGMSPNTVKSICRKHGFMPRAVPMKNVNNAMTLERLPLCKFCGKAMDNPWNRRNKEFCSDRCRYSWHNRERRILGYVPVEGQKNISKKTLDFQPQKRD